MLFRSGEDLNLIGLDDIEKSISKDNLAETWMDKSKKDITSEDLTHVDKKADNPMDRLKKWMKNK